MLTNNTTPTHDIFICHAGEDKDTFARPLAVALRDAGLDVWFDEFELRPGQGLRRSLDAGLAGSRYGIVILSRAFFGKRWPEYELDGMTQLLGDGRLIPIWHGVDVDDVKRYSGPLADRIAILSAKGVDHAVAELRRTVASADTQASRAGRPTEPQAPSAPSVPEETSAETVSRVRALIQTGRGLTNTLVVAVACVPRREALRPKEFSNSELRRALLREAIFGSHPIFDSGQPTKDGIAGDELVLEQVEARVTCTAEGSVTVAQPAVPRRSPFGGVLPCLVIEEVEDRLTTTLAFVAGLLDELDSERVWTEVAVTVGLLGCQHLGWRTREEAQRNPNRLSMNLSSGDAIVDGRPPRRPRQDLRDGGRALAEDLTDLLGRQLRTR
jgi:TIR domain